MLVIADGFRCSASCESWFYSSSWATSITRTDLDWIWNLVVPKELALFPFSMLWRTEMVRFRIGEAPIWIGSILIGLTKMWKWNKRRMRKQKQSWITNISESLLWYKAALSIKGTLNLIISWSSCLGISTSCIKFTIWFASISSSINRISNLTVSYL